MASRPTTPQQRAVLAAMPLTGIVRAVDLARRLDLPRSTVESTLYALSARELVHHRPGRGWEKWDFGD